MIFSSDNDVPMFAFEHLHYPVLICPKLSLDESYVLRPSFLGKNLVRMALLIEKTDYFNGVFQVGFTEALLKKLNKGERPMLMTLAQKEFDLEYLLMIIYMVSKPAKPACEDGSIVREILDNTKLFLSMASSFFQEKKSFPAVTKGQLNDFFLHRSSLLKTLFQEKPL